jgi:hypothetical protein
MTPASSPSLNISRRLPDASRKSNALNRRVPCSTAPREDRALIGEAEDSPKSPMSDRLSRMLS